MDPLEKGLKILCGGIFAAIGLVFLSSSPPVLVGLYGGVVLFMGSFLLGQVHWATTHGLTRQDNGARV
jgi:hypothetical protein